MLNIVRYIPHPSYGNYGGRKNKCKGLDCPIPIDWMDAAFASHDIDLKAKNKDADKILGEKLQNGDPKDLKLKPNWFAKLYYLTCKNILFRVKNVKKHS